MPQCQFLFSAVFVFQKSCTVNILGIARDKIPGSYFSVTKPEPEGEQQRANRVARHGPGAANPWPAPALCLGPLASVDSASSPIYSPPRENPRHQRRNPRKAPSRPSSQTLVRGTEVSVLAHCRDGELPPDPSPSTPPPSPSPLLTPMMRRE